MQVNARRTIIALLASAPLLVSAAAQQQEQPQETAPAPPPDAQVSDAAGKRTPLLREGSTLLRAVGRVRLDERSRRWTFTPVATGDQLQRTLLILPNSTLWELQQTAEPMRDRVLRFEVTGTVFVYEGRNYLLLTHPPLLVGRDESSAGASAGAEVDDVERPAGDERPPEVAAGDTAEEIIRQLQEQAGPVTGRPLAESQPQAVAVEGEMILHRRGMVRRSRDGSFVFVFTADEDALADPPMILMPCLLLERLEQTLDQRGAQTPLLISGQVFAYDGRNYLLPSLYRVPVERTPLEG